MARIKRIYIPTSAIYRQQIECKQRFICNSNGRWLLHNFFVHIVVTFAHTKLLYNRANDSLQKMAKY